MSLTIGAYFDSPDMADLAMSALRKAGIAFEIASQDYAGSRMSGELGLGYFADPYWMGRNGNTLTYGGDLLATPQGFGDMVFPSLPVGDRGSMPQETYLSLRVEANDRAAAENMLISCHGRRVESY